MPHFVREQPRRSMKSSLGVTPRENPGLPISFRSKLAWRQMRHRSIGDPGLTRIKAHESTDRDKALLALQDGGCRNGTGS
jgi:hypothetical protein